MYLKHNIFKLCLRSWFLKLAGVVCVFLLVLPAYSKNIQIKTIINGLPKPLTTALQNTLPLNIYSDYLDKHPKQIKILFSRSTSTINQALKAYGYYHAKINAHLTHNQSTLNSNSHSQWTAQYTIQLGKPILIQSLNIKILGNGQNNPILQQLLKNTPLKLNKRLNQNQYTKFKESLINTAISLGYLDSVYTQHTIWLSPFYNTAQISLNLNTHKRYFVHKIQFIQNLKNSGNTAQNPPFSLSFLKRFTHLAHIISHQPYLYQNIQTLQNALNSSGYFSDVTITPQILTQTHQVNLKIHLTPVQSQAYTLGVGYGTETGYRGLLGWQLKRIGQDGQSFSAEIQASQKYRTFTARYIFPGKNPLTDKDVLSAGQAYTNVAPYTATQTQFAFENIQQLNHWNINFGLQTNLIYYAQNNIPKKRQHYLTPYLNIGFQNTHKIGVYPIGYRWNLYVQAALKEALSSATFLKAVLNYNYAWSLSPKTRFYTSFNMGALQTEEFNSIAPPLRFYAGGVGSILGYDYLSLSPINSNNTLIGGQYLFTNSYTLEHQLYHQLSGLVIYNYGNVFNHFSHIYFYQGAGIGLSWKTSVGPVSIYLSHPINHSGGWHIDLNVGGVL